MISFDDWRKCSHLQVALLLIFSTLKSGSSDQLTMFLNVMVHLKLSRVNVKSWNPVLSSNLLSTIAWNLCLGAFLGIFLTLQLQLKLYWCSWLKLTYTRYVFNTSTVRIWNWCKFLGDAKVVIVFLKNVYVCSMSAQRRVYIDCRANDSNLPLVERADPNSHLDPENRNFCSLNNIYIYIYTTP